MTENELAHAIGKALVGSNTCLMSNQIAVDVEYIAELVTVVLNEKHNVVEDDCWYTCDVATEERDGGECCNELKGDKCDCSRKARVQRYLEIIAKMVGVK